MLTFESPEAVIIILEVSFDNVKPEIRSCRAMSRERAYCGAEDAASRFLKSEFSAASFGKNCAERNQISKSSRNRLAVLTATRIASVSFASCPMT